MKQRWGDKLTKTMEISALWDDTPHIVVDVVERAKNADGRLESDALEQTQIQGNDFDLVAR